MHEVKKYIGGCEVYCQRRILLFFAAMSHIESQEVERVMQALPPEARLALNTMAELQKRPVEDVLRDEIARYIEGKVPSIDIDSAMQGIKATAWQAGYFIGRLRSFARRMSEDG